MEEQLVEDAVREEVWIRAHPLERLELAPRMLHRAQYEEFAFRLIGGDVLVRNGSYADPASHKYRVTINDGLPVRCTCPADAWFDVACKHREAPTIRRRVQESCFDIDSEPRAVYGRQQIVDCNTNTVSGPSTWFEDQDWTRVFLS